MHNGSEPNSAERARMLFLISRVVQAFLAIQIGYDIGQIRKILGDSKKQIEVLLGSEHARPIVKKYLECSHPNLMPSEFFCRYFGAR